MKKKVFASIISLIFIFSCVISAFALTDDESISRKRAYYSGINSTISLLSNNLGTLHDIHINRIVITSLKDFTSESAVKENVLSESSSLNLSYSVLVAIQFSASDGNTSQDYLFSHYLAAGSNYNLLPLSSSDLTIYNYNNALSYFNDYGKSIGTGIAYLNSLGERYFLDIDLNDYQNSGYSLSIPIVQSSVSVESTTASVAPTTEAQPSPTPVAEPVAEAPTQVEPIIETPVQSEPIASSAPIVEPAPSYTKNQKLIISGQTNFKDPYTFTDNSVRYSCFTVTSGSTKWYAAVSPDEYQYFKSAFTNHSLTLEGTYKGIANDGSPVVHIINLVEGKNKTNLRTYLWNLNKGSSKNPNFPAYVTLKGDGIIMSASKDGSSLTIDSNPLGASPKSQAYKDFLQLALLFIKNANSDFGLPDWLYTDIINTRPIDGKQKEEFDNITVSWSYSTSGGVNVIYRKN